MKANPNPNPKLSVDVTLIARAEKIATGANIHQVRGHIYNYRCAVELINATQNRRKWDIYLDFIKDEEEYLRRLGG